MFETSIFRDAETITDEDESVAGPNVESAVAQPYLPYQRKQLKRTSKTAVSWRTTKRVF